MRASVPSGRFLARTPPSPYPPSRAKGIHCPSAGLTNSTDIAHDFGRLVCLPRRSPRPEPALPQPSAPLLPHATRPALRPSPIRPSPATPQVGRELRGAHVDVNFAPVVDVNTNPLNPVIGDRALGADPALVSRLGQAIVTGMQATGVPWRGGS